MSCLLIVYPGPKDEVQPATKLKLVTKKRNGNAPRLEVSFNASIVARIQAGKKAGSQPRLREPRHFGVNVKLISACGHGYEQTLCRNDFAPSRVRVLLYPPDRRPFRGRCVGESRSRSGRYFSNGQFPEWKASAGRGGGVATPFAPWNPTIQSAAA